MGYLHQPRLTDPGARGPRHTREDQPAAPSSFLHLATYHSCLPQRLTLVDDHRVLALTYRAPAAFELGRSKESLPG